MHVDMYAGDLTNGLSLQGGILTPGCWGHVAFTADAAGNAKLFVDGTEVASGKFKGIFFAFACVTSVFSAVSLHLFYQYSSSALGVVQSSPFISTTYDVRKTPSSPGTRMLLEDCEMGLGKSLDADGNLNGYVYDFRLWSRALCAADVASGRKVRNYRRDDFLACAALG